MQIGMIGLGRMGANMVRRLLAAGHTCVVYDRSPEAVAALEQHGAVGASSLADMVAKLEPPRAPRPVADVARRGDRCCAGATSTFAASR